MNKSFTLLPLTLCLLLTNPLYAAEEREKEHAEEAGLRLNAEQRQRAGIVVETLILQPIANVIEAPGEIRLNSYATRQVTPRIEAQVIARHAQLGDTVTIGQPLASLSSVAMSEAQGVMLTAENEWQRVRKLGRKVVAERRYQDARIAAQQARARLLAYGMTAEQIDKLASGNRIDQANGRFDLLAAINGTVVRDDFIIGQMVQPGNMLFEISDESKLWIEARLDPSSVRQIKAGSSARVMVDGQWYQSEVIQVHHALEETTRTLPVRLAISNPDDQIHPGQFVIVQIRAGDSNSTGILLTADAVLRSADGDWQVFIEHEPEEFEAKEVEVIRQVGKHMLIEGIEPGTRVVTEGAFFVQSELAKSGFDVHNH